MLNLSWAILLVASAGSALLGCGGTDSGTAQDTDEAETSKDAKDAKKDAGARKDAAKAGGKVGSACTGLGLECSSCDEAPCVQPCVDGELDECQPLSEVANDAVTALLDSGIGDQINNTISAFLDGGLRLPDGGLGININLLGDASLAKCPSSLTCEVGGTGSLLGIAAGLLGAVSGGRGAGICADAEKHPPACATNDDCKSAGLGSATCTDLGPGASLLMALEPTFPTKFCGVPCAP